MMAKGLVHIVTGLLILGICGRASAQPKAYIPGNGTIYVHPRDTVSLFGDLINQGSLGTMPGSVLNFYGKTWSNEDGSSLPDESLSGTSGRGGQIRFAANPGSGSYTGSQYLLGGYQLALRSGASFPNLAIANPRGVYLLDLSDLQVRNDLDFQQGHLYLDGWNLVMGIQDPGQITGYDQNRYVVTDTGQAGGTLYRSHMTPSDTAQIFPLGTDDQSYSPAAVSFRQGSDPTDVGLGVFDHVYDQGNTGQINDLDFVKKTWVLHTSDTADAFDLALQHNNSDEGARFALYRDSSYISHFLPDSGRWDYSAPSGPPYPGMLTSGGRQVNAHMNLRRDLNAPIYYTVSTLKYSGKDLCPVVDFAKFFGVRYNVRYVELFWRTNSEANVLKYEIQRRLQKEPDFKTITTVDSKAPGGFSNKLLYYYLPDNNMTDDWSYYRLKIIGLTGCITYSDIAKVPWGIEITAAPNPCFGSFDVHIFGVKHQIVMRLVTELGQITDVYNVAQDQTIHVENLAPAIYYLEFRDPRNNMQVMKDTKIIVLRR